MSVLRFCFRPLLLFRLTAALLELGWGIIKIVCTREHRSLIRALWHAEKKEAYRQFARRYGINLYEMSVADAICFRAGCIWSSIKKGTSGR